MIRALKTKEECLQDAIIRDMSNGKYFYKKLSRYAENRFRNYQTAEDCVTDFILKIIPKAKQYDYEIDPNGEIEKDRQLKGWLFKSFSNYVIDLQRKENKGRIVNFSSIKISDNQNLDEDNQSSVLDYIAIDKETPEKTAIENERQNLARELIYDGLDNLSDELSEVLILNMENLKYREIAKALNMPLGTVKSRMFHGKSKLAEIIKEDKRVRQLIDIN